MQKELVMLPEIKLVGLKVRTNNKDEMNPKTAKIGDLFQRFFKDVPDMIQHRKHPGILFSVYTDYASDEHGDYTYFIGEEVLSFEKNPSFLNQLVIAPATYQRFTTPSGAIPQVVIGAWQSIWQMSPTELGGKRTYQADFEVYDERAKDTANAIADIYIGIKK